MKGIWDWLDDPRRVGRLKMGFVVVLAVLVVIDPILHKHSYLELQDTPSIGAIFGLGGVLVIAGGGLLWGMILRRRRYDDE